MYGWVSWSYQRRHSESDDLDAAVVVSLRSKVVVLTRVTPGHGAGTVPMRHKRANLIDTAAVGRPERRLASNLDRYTLD